MRRIILLGLLTPLLAWAEKATKSAPDFSKPQAFLRLADAFADEKDYYRAITEYKKVVHLFPDYEKIDWVHFQIGKLYYEGGRYAQAKNALLPLVESRDAKLRFYSLNYIALCYYENAEYANAERLFAELANEPQGTIYTLDYTIYRSMASAGGRNFSAALSQLNQAEEIWKKQKTKENENSPSYQQYGHFFDQARPVLERGARLSEKSPFWSGFFSAILPGAGHFYLGEWDTGVVSLSLVGAAAFLAYDGFARESAVQAVIFTTFATGAYIGQVYSAYRSARKHNGELGDAEFRELSRHFRSLSVALQFSARF